MRVSSTDLLQRYQLWRRVAEPGFWIALYLLQASVNSWLVLLDLRRAGLSTPWWQVAVWEWSSNLVLLALVPAVVLAGQMRPLQLVFQRQNLRFHLAVSVAYSLVHVAAMVALRKLAYWSQGSSYDFGNWWHELPYEYVKDVRAYFMVLLVVGFYRLLLMRWQGEATLLAEPDEGPAVEPVEQPERFLVRKLGKDFLLPAADIEWLQAWGNYVNLHVRGHDYPLRSTMAAIERRLDPACFVRVHRSYIVNLAFVQSIVPLDSGDARASLSTGSEVPVSRRYRDALKKVSAM
ncbi:LytTR family DNA-binding domain-containing protein [Janthinobacterium aquaticum]|uniref:LytTR family DNA-binding domain-containing protein n=1 Tax=Janthinobacterium sp. FT58W TaxID=2654254 RepID=UPI001264488D|nr:LytTR family DNA-binding domain-containing protein [Janthinobacterium sp. FT58W]KAB8044052.1 LytTR family transcriptional regulator [Janthinobacterium sp. FT58W]